MKRMILLGLGAMAILFAVAVSAQAQNPTTPQNPPARGAGMGANFVDANGDGICDNFQNGGLHQGQGQGRGKGHGRGMGNGAHVGPQDGTGFGATAQAGTCDGTGPKGKGRGPRR